MRRFFIVAFSHITTEHLLHIRDLSLQEPRERRGNGSPHTSCVIVTSCPHSCAYRLFLPCSPIPEALCCLEEPGAPGCCSVHTRKQRLYSKERACSWTSRLNWKLQRQVRTSCELPCMDKTEFCCPSIWGCCHPRAGHSKHLFPLAWKNGKPSQKTCIQQVQCWTRNPLS